MSDSYPSKKSILKSKKIRRNRNPKGDSHGITELKSILPAVGDALGLAQKTQEMAVLSLWNQQVPQRYQGKTRPLRLKLQGEQWILQVIVTNGAVASELSFELLDIAQRINLFTAQTGIHIERIDLGVGQVEKPGC